MFGPAAGFASREREWTHALQDAVALIHVAAEGTRRITPVVEWSPPVDSGAGYVGANPPCFLGDNPSSNLSIIQLSLAAWSLREQVGRTP